MKKAPAFAVIGGSGLYEVPGLARAVKCDVGTPFGKPSSPIVIGEVEGVNIAFLARHGEGHYISPSQINYRANIYALKSIGVERIVGVCACGSLRRDFAPGQIVIPKGLFDFTKKRSSTFFDEGIVVHVGVAEPFCFDLSQKLYRAVLTTGAAAHRGGNFITIEGPRFSTRAESETFRSWGMSLVGMTTSPEAFLAREAQMCYSVMALVTDYDVWHKSEEVVSWDKIAQTMTKNTTLAIAAIRNLAKTILYEKKCDCDKALANAISTRGDLIDKKTRKRLGLLLSKYLK